MHRSERIHLPALIAALMGIAGLLALILLVMGRPGSAAVMLGIAGTPVARAFGPAVPTDLPLLSGTALAASASSTGTAASPQVAADETGSAGGSGEAPAVLPAAGATMSPALANVLPSATALPATGPAASATPELPAPASLTPLPPPTATPLPLLTATPLPLPTATPLPPATATPLPAPTATPPPTATPSPSPSPRPALSARGVAARLASAEAGVQSGHLDATIRAADGSGSSSSMDFDLRSGPSASQYHLVTVAPAAGRSSTLELVGIGDRVWQRQPNGSWTALSVPQGLREQVANYLFPQPDSAAGVKFVNGDKTTIAWYDPARDGDVTVRVDPDTGIPRQMSIRTRNTGALLIVNYSRWNEPVDIPKPGLGP